MCKSVLVGPLPAASVAPTAAVVDRLPAVIVIGVLVGRTEGDRAICGRLVARRAVSTGQTRQMCIMAAAKLILGHKAEAYDRLIVASPIGLSIRANIGANDSGRGLSGAGDCRTVHCTCLVYHSRGSVNFGLTHIQFHTCSHRRRQVLVIHQRQRDGQVSVQANSTLWGRTGLRA